MTQKGVNQAQQTNHRQKITKSLKPDYIKPSIY